MIRTTLVLVFMCNQEFVGVFHLWVTINDIHYALQWLVGKSVELKKYKIEMRNVCLNHNHNHRELSTAKSNLMGKSGQMEESSNYASLNQRPLKFHYHTFLWHALPLSYSSFTRSQNRTGNLTTRGSTLYAFFWNKNIFAITTEIRMTFGHF